VPYLWHIDGILTRTTAERPEIDDFVLCIYRAREAGCDRFLVKPCLPDVLALELRDLLVLRQQGDACDVLPSQS
jgi:hypothetical protein